MESKPGEFFCDMNKVNFNAHAFKSLFSPEYRPDLHKMRIHDN